LTALSGPYLGKSQNFQHLIGDYMFPHTNSYTNMRTSELNRDHSSYSLYSHITLFILLHVAYAAVPTTLSHTRNSLCILPSNQSVMLRAQSYNLPPLLRFRLGARGECLNFFVLCHNRGMRRRRAVHHRQGGGRVALCTASVASDSVELGGIHICMGICMWEHSVPN